MSSIGIDVRLHVYGRTWDMALDSEGDIETEDAFNTAILVSFFVDSRADASEIPAPENRRGWVGNESTPGIEMGSKLWIYYQSRLTPQVAGLLGGVGSDALQWFIEDGYALSASAVAELFSEEILRLTARIEHPNSRVDYRHFDLWVATGV